MDKPDVIGMFVNPYYAISIHKNYFIARKDQESDGWHDRWLDQNIELLESIDPSEYFNALLDVLANPNKVMPYRKIVNPTRAVLFHTSLKGNHKPKVDRKIWIHTNTQLLNDGLTSLGWLENFLLHMENPQKRYY